MLQEKYINPFTDFGFKKLFGEEISKDLLQDFLTSLLYDETGEITELQFAKNEHLGLGLVDRGALFDIYCTNAKGEKFIVEMQKAKQLHFKDRSLFYASFPIQEQAQQGNWNFELKAIYSIGILDFVFDDDKDEKDKFFYKIKLTDIETCKVFYDKLTFVYLEMPKFNKPIEALESKFDKWLYLLKHLPYLQERPLKLQEKVFEKAFSIAELAKFNRSERSAYEDSLKHYRDMKNVIDTAYIEGIELGKQEGIELGKQEGIEIGIKEGKIKTAQKLKEKGFTNAEVQEITGLDLKDIESL